MDKIYLEFLEELAYSLKEYENSYWSNWMQKSSLLFQQTADLNYFLVHLVVWEVLMIIFFLV